MHVTHGWRSTFSTIMNEPAAVENRVGDRAIINLMLAHIPSGVKAAYNRAAYMPRRRELAQEWADMLVQEPPPVASLLTGLRQHGRFARGRRYDQPFPSRDHDGQGPSHRAAGAPQQLGGGQLRAPLLVARRPQGAQRAHPQFRARQRPRHEAAGQAQRRAGARRAARMPGPGGRRNGRFPETHRSKLPLVQAWRQMTSGTHG